MGHPAKKLDSGNQGSGQEPPELGNPGERLFAELSRLARGGDLARVSTVAFHARVEAALRDLLAKFGLQLEKTDPNSPNGVQAAQEVFVQAEALGGLGTQSFYFYGTDGKAPYVVTVDFVAAMHVRHPNGTLEHVQPAVIRCSWTDLRALEKNRQKMAEPPATPSQK